MNNEAVLKYFEDLAKNRQWNSIYNHKNPISYSFIVRLQKAIRLARQFKDRRVLDLGCGTGVLMPFVIDEGGQYIGLDVSRQMLEELRRIYPCYVNNNNVQLILGDIKKTSLPDNIDIIIGLGFIEYLDSPDELIKMLYNKLLRGGRLILSFPNFCSLDYASIQFLAPFRYLAKRIFNRFTSQPPRMLWNTKRAKSLYIKTGFENLEIVNYNINIFSYPFTRISAPFANYWARRFEYSALSKCSFFATGFLISGEK